jgi:hypothetical protein
VAAAAGVAIPATGRRGLNNTQRREVLGTLGTRLGRSGGGGTSWNHELAVGGANGRVADREKAPAVLQCARDGDFSL